MATRYRVISIVNSSIPVTRHGIAHGLLDSVEGAVTPMPPAGEANPLSASQAQGRIRRLWVQTEGPPPTPGMTISAPVRFQQRPPVAGGRHRFRIVKPKRRRVGGATPDRIQQQPPVAGGRHRLIVKPKSRRVGGVTMTQAILVLAPT
jgi:hypothetical protein